MEHSYWTGLKKCIENEREKYAEEINKNGTIFCCTQREKGQVAFKNEDVNERW